MSHGRFQPQVKRMVQRHQATEERDLTFHEQSDGKMVAFIGQKCVIMDRDDKLRVKSGETWRVKLVDKGMYFFAFADVKVADPAARTQSLGALAPQVEKIINAMPTSLAKPTPVVAFPVAPATVVAPTTSAKPDPRRTTGPMTLEGMLLEPDNIIRATDRVAFFVDGANIDNASAHVGFILDWRKTLGYFIGKGVFGGAYYFGTDYMQDDAQVRFHDALAGAGFTVRTKPVKLIKDLVTGEERLKGNVDIELALEMIARCDTFDVAYLFSGDSDFKRVLEILQSRGKRVLVVTTRSSVSRELIHAADKPVFFIEDFRKVLAREG